MSLAVKAKVNQPRFKELAQEFGQNFVIGAYACHDMWVMRVLEYFAKFSRVATGRSRAGWFKFMDMKAYDYYRSLPPTGTDKVDETEEGRAQGDFISQPFNTVIINNVKYVDPMNRRFGLFGFANTTSGKMHLGSQGIHLEEKIPLFEQYGAQNFQKYLDNADKAFSQGGKKFMPGEIEPIENDPPMTE